MISRRIFLKDGGLALVSLGFAPQFLARTVAAAAPRRKVLITIFQRGAVDGLNMIVPFGERDYYASRPSIAIARPGTSPDAAHRSRRLLRPASADGAAQAALRRAAARDRPRVRIARRRRGRTSTRRTTWRRRRPASRARATAGSIAICMRESMSRRRRSAPSRWRRSCRGRCRASRRRWRWADRPVRHPRRPVDRHGPGLVRSRVRGGRRSACSTAPAARRSMRPDAARAPIPARYAPRERRAVSAHRRSARRSSRSRS